MRHSTRGVTMGQVPESVLHQLARRTESEGYGEVPELVMPGLDQHGRPSGNRTERRMAARLLRQGKITNK